MGIVEERNYQPLGPEDPDDYRPNSRIAFVFDPDSGDGSSFALWASSSRVRARRLCSVAYAYVR